MKQFLVFSGLRYYPSQGIKDFRGSFDSEVEGLKALLVNDWDKDWFQIVDRDSFNIVQEKT